MDTQGPQGPVRLDAIRAQLRHLGYLSGPLSGLESWMIAGRGGPSSFLRINLIASLRAALIGGALLGLPATAAVAIANRPHVSAPRDLALLFLYLASMLGAALGVLEFCTDTALAWMSRRGLVLVGRAEKLAARVGLLFFAATTLYLACLVRSGRAALRSGGGGVTGGEGVAAWLLWIAAVIGVLAVGHLIGRLARFGSLVALVAAGGGAILGERLTLPARRRLMLPAVVLLVLLAAGLLVFGPPGFYKLSLGSGSAFQRAEMKGKLAVIGVDGLDAAWYDRMKPIVDCPSLHRIESQGARYDMQADGPRVPPAVWSTIATGRPSSEHGILGYQADRLPGLTVPLQERPEAARFTFSLKLLLPPLRPAPSPVSSGLRRARAVWEILTEGGVATAVVNWWATWPAEPGDGTVISERAFTRLLAGSQPDRDVAPGPLQSDLAGRFAADLEQVHRDIGRARSGNTAVKSGTAGGSDDDLIRTSEVIDGYHGLVARRLLGAGLAQATFVYLPGLDIARTRVGKQTARTGQDLLLAPVLANVDRILGEFVAQSGPDDLVMLIGDPGRGGDAGATGLVMVWGGRVNQGHRARLLSRFDLGPTILALAGFPTARDLPGSPVVDFLKVGDVASRLAPRIESYGSRPEPEAGSPEDPFDAEVLDRLRSLGYIQ